MSDSQSSGILSVLRGLFKSTKPDSKQLDRGVLNLERNEEILRLVGSTEYSKLYAVGRYGKLYEYYNTKWAPFLAENDIRANKNFTTYTVPAVKCVAAFWSYHVYEVAVVVHRLFQHPRQLNYGYMGLIKPVLPSLNQDTFLRDRIRYAFKGLSVDFRHTRPYRKYYRRMCLRGYLLLFYIAPYAGIYLTSYHNPHWSWQDCEKYGSGIGGVAMLMPLIRRYVKVNILMYHQQKFIRGSQPLTVHMPPGDYYYYRGISWVFSHPMLRGNKWTGTFAPAALRLRSMIGWTGLAASIYLSYYACFGFIDPFVQANCHRFLPIVNPFYRYDLSDSVAWHDYPQSCVKGINFHKWREGESTWNDFVNDHNVEFQTYTRHQWP